MMSRFWAYCAVLLIALPGCIGSEEPDIFYGEDINPPIPVSDFLLVDQDGVIEGEPATQAVFFSLLFF